MFARSLCAAATLLALSATQSAAQTTDELTQIFFAAGWTSEATDDPVVGCITHFSNGATAGYEITLVDGTRAGELRFTWRGEPQVIAYEFDFTQGGERATYGRVAWTNPDEQIARAFRSNSGRDLDLVRRQWGEDYPALVVASEFVWRADFCSGAPRFADWFPAADWTPIDSGGELQGAVACAASFGPLPDYRRGYHVEYADGTIFGSLRFAAGGESWSYAYRSGIGVDGGQSLSLAYRLVLADGTRSGAVRFAGTPQEAIAAALEPTEVTGDMTEADAAYWDAFNRATIDLIEFVLSEPFCE